MKKFFAILVMLCIAVPAVAADFRQADWGMSLKKVKKTEKEKPIIRTDDLLVYEGSLNALDVRIEYRFLDGQLAGGRYDIVERHWARNDYIASFETFKKLLTKKYGEPAQDEVIWNNAMYRNSPPNWGLAVSMGHLSYLTAWDLPGTRVEMTLAGDDLDIKHEILYGSTAMVGKGQTAAEKQVLEDL